MKENDQINAVADEIRSMASKGESIPSLLRRIQREFGRKDCKIISARCFHKAFGGRLGSVSPVAGWTGFGGELTDDEVESLLFPVLQEFRERLEHG